VPNRPRPISDVLTDLSAEDSPLSPDAQNAIRDGISWPHESHRLCPCPECMRAYLRAAERGDLP